jgi:antitoxin PrlF
MPKQRKLMSESMMTANGRTTVPLQVRERIGAGPGTQLVWSVSSEGDVTVRTKTTKGEILAALRQSPLVGVELNLTRSRGKARKVDL